jgi:trk system potassium uptake protein
MNYKSILFFLGFNLILVSIFSILNILYAFYFDFFINITSYLITFFSSIIIGIIFFCVGFEHYRKINLPEQVATIFLSFIIIPLFISIPYFLSVYNISFLNSYFESVSGLTTTGFSILPNIKDIDDPLVLWRSSSQWFGGLLFLIATIGTIGSKQIMIKPSYLISGGASGRNFYNNYSYNFIKIFLIYTSTTIFIIFLYSFFNIRLLDAFNLAFTTISSGGFISSNNLSDIINNYGKTFILSVSLLFPIFNFFLLFDIFTRQFKFKNHSEDIHIFVLIIFLTLIVYFFIIPYNNFFYIFLSIVSSISTSGITLSSPKIDLSLFYIILTIISGSLISTSSGLKYTRFYILLKISYQEIYRLVKPINIIDKNLYNAETKIRDQDFRIAFLVFISFVISIFILASILTFDVLSFEDSFKLSILSLTNTVNSSLYGLSNISFLDLSNFTKLSLIIFMILGKIEIIAAVYLMKKFIFKE